MTRRGKKSNTQRAKEKATRLHSLIVRSKGYCENCGDAWQANGSKLECAHIVSRRFSATRTDLDNAFCLCSKCHFRFTEWPLEMAHFVLSKIGERKYEALREKAHNPLVKVDWPAEAERLDAIWKQIESEAA